MSRDPIVDEVRQARQKILEECGGDLEKLLDRLKAAEAQDRSRVVSMKSHLPLNKAKTPAAAAGTLPPPPPRRP
jgi:hypothetical protein